MPNPDGIRRLTVTQLTNQVKGRLEEHFAEFWVAGQILKLKHPPSGHVYFTLSDAGATLPCKYSGAFYQRRRFELTEGQQVFCRGGLTVWPPSGAYQLEVVEMEERGIGEAELALRELKAKLLAKGYFAQERKRRIPAFPRYVAFVTSASGDAVRDMIQTTLNRWPLVGMVVFSCRVQGQNAAEEIADRLRTLCRMSRQGHLELCAIVLGRGGGSAADLSAFNAEIVADAIYASSVPVISAVGHETDFSIADSVADVRAVTPTDAIIRLTPDCQSLRAKLRNLEQRLHGELDSRIAHARKSLRQREQRTALRRPYDRVQAAARQVDERANRLNLAMQNRLALAGERLSAAAGQLQALSPLNVLARGYSLTKRGDGALLRDLADVAPGEIIETELAGGTLLSRVISTTPTPAGTE